MSRMQEASEGVECTYAQLASSITQETSNQESVPWLPEAGCHEARHSGRAGRNSVAWIHRDTKSRDRQHGSDPKKESKSRTIARPSSPVGERPLDARSRSIGHKVSNHLPVARSDNDSLDAQIRRFKQREDLRECLLPGMLSGISPQACEGWQRQATARTGRFIAKIKLGPCKECRYFAEPNVAVGRKV